MIERFIDGTGEARVDDGGRSARLGNEAVSYKFFGHG